MSCDMVVCFCCRGEFEVSRELVVPIPPQSPSTTRFPFTPGDKVFALFPDTSTFYEAVISSPPTRDEVYFIWKRWNCFWDIIFEIDLCVSLRCVIWYWDDRMEISPVLSNSMEIMLKMRKRRKRKSWRWGGWSWSISYQLQISFYLILSTINLLLHLLLLNPSPNLPLLNLQLFNKMKMRRKKKRLWEKRRRRRGERGGHEFLSLISNQKEKDKPLSILLYFFLYWFFIDFQFPLQLLSIN